MTDSRPKTAEEYVRLVEQALVEIDELRSSFDYDIEDAGGSFAFIEPLEEGLKRLRGAMVDGSYHFENKDLPFMVIVKRFRSKIPFTDLLVTINRTHREGLNIDEA